nr:corrinoid protein [candidate division Zixibacteria bacterium]
MDILAEISKNLENGDDEQVGRLTREALDQKIPAKTILDNGLLAGMKTIGAKFKNHEIFLPDVLLAARAMYAGLDLLKPHLIADDVPMVGRVVLGTVQGDLHDIGKNLVGIMLKGAGFEIVDLGNDVPPERFINAALENEASVIGLSALLTTTMPNMKKVVDLVREKGLSDRIKVIIGGAPVTEEYAGDIGADAYAFDGVNSVDRIKQLLNIE